MGKGMWLRCPECGDWCYAQKENFLGRIVRSVTKGDKETGDTWGQIGDSFLNMKGTGKTIGRALNALDIYKHAGEMLNGDNYRFYCKCGHEFGTDNEDMDMTKEHDLYMKTKEVSKQFVFIKNSSELEKKNFTREVQEILANVENVYGIDDAKATLYDVLACCYFYFYNDSSNALLEINKSLDLFDDEKSHILKGLFMGKVVTPADNYSKMNELLKINDCDCPSYVDKTTIVKELEESERKYGGNFISIPESQRKFLVITSDYTYLPNSFKVIKYNDTELSGIVFENGFPTNNAIYVCHPYKSYVYYPSESYQTDLFKNQLNELRELLQCLGAKSITTENSLSLDKNINNANDLNAKAGGEYKGVGANTSYEHNTSTSTMESIMQKMLIDDEFSFNPDTYPFVPEGLVWYDHMEEWQRLSRMRLRGQNKYSIIISSKLTHIVNENEANQVNLYFKALVAKGNLEISNSTELKVSETKSHEWKLVVEFYPLSNYEKRTKPTEAYLQSNIQQTDTQHDSINKSLGKNKNLIYALIGIIAILLVIIVFIALK